MVLKQDNGKPKDRKLITSEELRNQYVGYFTGKGHKQIAPASLLPENDPSVLFTTAGMHPLVPYLLGEKHPFGRRLVDYQKCIRTGDIDEVGDATHLTYFEMLGNWSLGDYFKQESIQMSYDFLTNSLGIPKEKLAVTVFKGDNAIPKDMESFYIWKEAGLLEEQIYFYDRRENWWGPAGQTGPCGPDTEIFYDTGKEKCSSSCGPACNCGKFIEIWNNVFMEYNQLPDGSFERLEQRNVDTGMGLERILAVINGKTSVYETDLLEFLLKKTEEITGLTSCEENIREFRIICDHMRAVTFILGDDKAVVPSGSEQGYILRRLIRRTIRILKNLGVTENVIPDIAEAVIANHGQIYPELYRNRDFILEQLKKEYLLFGKTLDLGLKMAEKLFNQLQKSKLLDGESAFKLYDTYGFPIEFTKELAEEKGFRVDLAGFREKYREHQEKSRTGAGAMFKGGLADNTEQTAKLHTATHLLNGALRRVLGETVFQKGSNINGERLRFDFSFDRKLTQEELFKVEGIVNEAIQKDIQVVCEEMSVEEAKGKGAIGVFDNKYGEIVKVYSIVGYSMEICGGPHAENTGSLKNFKVIKEESSSAGVRRIKGVIG